MAIVAGYSQPKCACAHEPSASSSTQLRALSALMYFSCFIGGAYIRQFFQPLQLCLVLLCPIIRGVRKTFRWLRLPPPRRAGLKARRAGFDSKREGQVVASLPAPPLRLFLCLAGLRCAAPQPVTRWPTRQERRSEAASRRGPQTAARSPQQGGARLRSDKARQEAPACPGRREKGSGRQRQRSSDRDAVVLQGSAGRTRGETAATSRQAGKVHVQFLPQCRKYKTETRIIRPQQSLSSLCSLLVPLTVASSSTSSATATAGIVEQADGEEGQGTTDAAQHHEQG